MASPGGVVGRLPRCRGVVRVEASLELLAPREDVWTFLAEPHHLPDWWPGVAGVQPDRRGFSAGARWQVSRTNEPTLLRRARSSDTLLVHEVERPALAAWRLVGEKLDVEVRLEPVGAERTRATVTVSGPWVLGFRRSLARRAVSRLHALCQTAARL